MKRTRLCAEGGKKNGKVLVSFRFSSKMKAKLERESKATNLSQTRLVEKAIDALLARKRFA